MLNLDFLTFRFLDLVDVLLLAVMFYFLYKLVKETIALNIFIGLLVIYFFWLLVKAMNMQLMANIIGQFIGVGVIALLIVFQQEIRRFLLFLGRSSFFHKWSDSLRHLFSKKRNEEGLALLNYSEIISAYKELKKQKNGALVVISEYGNMPFIAQSGTAVNADLNAKLLEAIFQKTSPLHDGAVLIHKNKVLSAGCVLPVSEENLLDKNLGLRHKSGLGVSETTQDAIVLILSEENGATSLAYRGQLDHKISAKRLTDFLKKRFFDDKIKD